MAAQKKRYPEATAKADFPTIEKDILTYWKEEGIFEASIEERPSGEKGENEYVFYDGPPFANGMPHYGHLVTGYVKDLVPRYQTMRGRKVDRRFGWDCHGLPAELSSEKDLGISGREQIQKYGVDKFNDYCKKAVLRYADEWETIVTRQARWVDFSNDYKTMDIDYMESVIWAFSELYKKGLMYEDVRVLPYSWAAETTVSNFETRLDNSYRERIDPAVTVLFNLLPKNDGEKPMHMMVWTTTPWTLPSNLALAVGPDIDYAIYEENGEQYVICEATAGNYKKQLETLEKVGTIKGSELIGRRYTPLFPYFEHTENAFQVISGDFITTEDGTGIVHIAPGFGEDDLNVCRDADIGVVCPVDNKGRFTKQVPEWEDQLVFDANKPIIKHLKERGKVVKHEQYKHNYPHCWRTDEPLIYKAVNSWFLKVTDIRERMVELNKEITWIPGHIKDGAFGKWIENARDWSISRNRFWGSPIPVWKSDDPAYPRIDVYGSLDDIERDFGVRPTDLHKPYIDELTRPNPDDPTGKSMMRRVDDVFDCWFESGSMPFAQVHYPFENREWFDDHFPADFIVEYIAQTRGWFYTLMVLGTALFDKPPFKTCVCHGVVLDENGQKLSKRLRNYPSPDEVFNESGADALRWFLISSPILKGGNLMIDRDGTEIKKAARKALIPLWNAYHFFCLYANADGIEAEISMASKDVLDRYILAKTRHLVEEVSSLLDANDIVAATGIVEEFVDILNNWYIRRSRARFWGGEGQKDAFNTLYTVLTTLTKLLAPMLPLITEQVYRGLTGEKSVHLTDWPEADAFVADDALVADMDKVRVICSAAKAVREEKGLRNRLPLASLTVAGSGLDGLDAFQSLIEDEVNVKNVKLIDDVNALADRFLYLHTPKIGKRLKQHMKTVMAASKTGDWSIETDGTLSIAGQTLAADEFEERLTPKDGYAAQALPDNTAVVALDTDVTSELEREGISRDFVRAIQAQRKALDLNVSDRIIVTYQTDDALVTEAVKEHEAYIADQVLAQAMTSGSPADAVTETVGSAKIAFNVAVS